MQKEYWQNKRAIVTGAGGLWGHLVRALASLGATVIPVIRKNGRSDISHREMLESFFKKSECCLSFSRRKLW